MYLILHPATNYYFRTTKHTTTTHNTHSLNSEHTLSLIHSIQSSKTPKISREVKSFFISKTTREEDLENMDASQTRKQIQQMCRFIEQEAREKVNEIKLKVSERSTLLLF